MMKFLLNSTAISEHKLAIYQKDPPNLKKSDSINNEWKEASSKRLLASGYFRTIQSMVTGMLQWVWGIIILPRIVRLGTIWNNCYR